MKNDWGFDESDIVVRDKKATIDAKAFEASVKKYNERISSHDCEEFGCTATKYNRDSNKHEFEEVWDDFQLSRRQREVIFMEVVRSRGRDNHERVLLRRFISTLDGSYWVRLTTATLLTVERMGDIRFEDEQESIDYYNYCVDLFGFSARAKITPKADGDGFFAALDAIEDSGFFSDLEELDEESDEDPGWDIEEEDEDDLEAFW